MRKLGALLLFATALTAQGPCNPGSTAPIPTKDGTVYVCVDVNAWQEMPLPITRDPLSYWRGVLVGLFAGAAIGAVGGALLISKRDRNFTE